MKVGDLVRIIRCASALNEEMGVITEFISLERGKNPQPVVMVGGRLRLYGIGAIEVVDPV